MCHPERSSPRDSTVAPLGAAMQFDSLRSLRMTRGERSRNPSMARIKRCVASFGISDEKVRFRFAPLRMTRAAEDLERKSMACFPRQANDTFDLIGGCILLKNIFQNKYFCISSKNFFAIGSSTLAPITESIPISSFSDSKSVWIVLGIVIDEF